MTEKNKGGRPPKFAAGDPKRTARKTVTLRQEHIDAITLLQQDDEEFSTTLQRLLDSHLVVAGVLRSLQAAVLTAPASAGHQHQKED